MQAAISKLLKKDIFGHVSLHADPPAVTRDVRSSRPWARWLARRLLAREARALTVLEGVNGVPRLLFTERDRLRRSWLDGEPMHVARPGQLQYFRDARRLLRQLHRRGIAHNDLAKEPNWLVTPAGKPAIVDFQLALHSPHRGPLFRILAREDFRHLLKHKRTYCAEQLTRREKSILASPTGLSRIWTHTGKRIYLLITRRLLGWADREGAGDR